MTMNRYPFLTFAGLVFIAAAFSHVRVYAEVLFVPVNGKPQVDRGGKQTIPSTTRPWHPIRPPSPNDLPFRVTTSKVQVQIQESVATTIIEQSFLNLSGDNLEVRVMIPLPAGASISESALSMNGEMVSGKLYSADEARNVYESIVRQRKDPALLRYVGENLYEARVFPIPPHEEKRLRFSYDHMLKPIGGLYDFRHILSGSQLYQSGLEIFEFQCRITCKGGIGPIYSPSHTVAVERPNADTAVVKMTDRNLSTDRDFQLYYGPSSEAVSLRLITHRAAENEDGFFMLMGRPDDRLSASRILPKDVVFVVDTSGSMAGEKMEQAQNALRFCLNGLNDADRFNLITFSSEVHPLNKGSLLEATKPNIKRALDAIDLLEATGGTDIDGALKEALNNDFVRSAERASLVIFLTDGRPSIGVTDAAQILKNVNSANNEVQTRIFSFGVGTDVNTHLLDLMSLDTGGSSAYVAPQEDLEVKVSDFYARVKNPVMTQVAIVFDAGAQTHSMYPRKIPALFKGSELIVFGRFKGKGPGEIILRGKVSGEERDIRINSEWPERRSENSFLPRVWAMRKIGYLLEEIRLHGSNRELIDEVVALSKLYGIVTPYTSQLVLEPEMQTAGRNLGEEDKIPAIRRRNMKDRLARELDTLEATGGSREDADLADDFAVTEKKAKEAAKRVADTANNQQSGDIAVALAATEEELKMATSMALSKSSVAAPGPREDQGFALRKKAFLADKGNSLSAVPTGQSGDRAEALGEMIEMAHEMTVKQVGNRTFYLRQGVWMDSTCGHGNAPAEKSIDIEAFSDEYFDLLHKHAELGPVLSLGSNIWFVLKGQAYRIRPKIK